MSKSATTKTERPFEPADFLNPDRLKKYTKGELGVLLYMLLRAIESVEDDAKRINEMVVDDRYPKVAAYEILRSEIAIRHNVLWWGIHENGKPLSWQEMRAKRDRETNAA